MEFLKLWLHNGIKPYISGVLVPRRIQKYKGLMFFVVVKFPAIIYQNWKNTTTFGKCTSRPHYLTPGGLVQPPAPGYLGPEWFLAKGRQSCPSSTRLSSRDQGQRKLKWSVTTAVKYCFAVEKIIVNSGFSDSLQDCYLFRPHNLYHRCYGR